MASTAAIAKCASRRLQETSVTAEWEGRQRELLARLGNVLKILHIAFWTVSTILCDIHDSPYFTKQNIKH